jgi:hypothetical protein
MRIIITKVGPSTTVKEVVAFLRAGARPVLGLGDPPTIEKCRVVRIVDDDTGDVEHVALARINPEKAALRAIKRLSRTRLKGRIVEVRQYHYRSSRNDRRRRSFPVVDEHDRRGHERRRPNLRFEKEAAPAKVEGMKEFRRTYGQ